MAGVTDDKKLICSLFTKIHRNLLGHREKWPKSITFNKLQLCKMNSSYSWSSNTLLYFNLGEASMNSFCFYWLMSSVLFSQITSCRLTLTYCLAVRRHKLQFKTVINSSWTTIAVLLIFRVLLHLTTFLDFKNSVMGRKSRNFLKAW